MKKRKEKPWNQCDVCGKFIAYDDFDNGAINYMATPDTDYSVESYVTLCKKHASEKIKNKDHT